MIGVYEIRNTVTGDCYIGSSVDIFARWAWHTDHLEQGAHPTQRLQRAWQEFGRTAFSFSVIQETTEGSRLAVEMALIQERRPLYNGKPGGDHPNSEVSERRGYACQDAAGIPYPTSVRLRIIPDERQFVEIWEYSDGHRRERLPKPLAKVEPYCPACKTPYQVHFQLHPLGVLFAATTILDFAEIPTPHIRRAITPDMAARCLRGRLGLSFTCGECHKPVLLAYAGKRPVILLGVCAGDGKEAGDIPFEPTGGKPGEAEDGDPRELRQRMARQDMEIRRLKLEVRTHARRLAAIEKHTLPPGTYFDLPDEPDE
jgi:hypothetical protein